MRGLSTSQIARGSFNQEFLSLSWVGLCRIGQGLRIGLARASGATNTRKCCFTNSRSTHPCYTLTSPFRRQRRQSRLMFINTVEIPYRRAPIFYLIGICSRNCTLARLRYGGPTLDRTMVRSESIIITYRCHVYYSHGWSAKEPLGDLGPPVPHDAA